MADEQTSVEPVNMRWAIGMDWFPQHNRSISAIARSCLCAACAKELETKKKTPTAESLIATIQKCCSQSPDFLNSRLPILECIFRIFLSNGNQPLAIEELIEQLSKSRGGNAYHGSPEMLIRVMRNDEYYGLQEIAG
jgi:hypothetical protein